MAALIDLFVYGLLMPGQSGYADLDLARRAQHLGAGRISGTLHDLVDYPGLILGGAGIVHGELLRSDEPDLLAELDAYELYDPENISGSEYQRVRIALLDGAEVAWTYVYSRPLDGQPVIASGDWRNR